MKLRVSVGEAEDAAALAVDVTAGSGMIGAHCRLPECVVGDYGCIAVVGVNT